MESSRRQVLRLGIAAAATMAAPFGLVERAFAATRLSRRTFTPRVGSAFTFVASGQTYRAVLSAVSDLPHSPAGDDHRFRLLFTVRDGGPSQGTYTFRASALSVTLFVVPVGGGRTYYEAVVAS